VPSATRLHTHTHTHTHRADSAVGGESISVGDEHAQTSRPKLQGLLLLSVAAVFSCCLSVALAVSVPVCLSCVSVCVGVGVCLYVIG
jgi:hypothetical protein